MALITSAQSGNFNATTTWTGGIIPGVGDEARASTGHTITISANATCDLISNLGTGNFVISNGVTLTANITSGSSTTATYVLRFLEASPAIAYVVGNVVYATINTASGINNAGTGTLTLTGNVSPGGLGSNAIGVNNASSGAIYITGNCTGATWTNSLCVNNNGIGSVTITGNVIGGNNTASPGVNNVTTGPVTITGNVSGGTVSPGLSNNSTATITLTGELTATTNAHAVISTNASSIVRVSGSFIYASNGLVPVNTTKFILLTTPTTAKTRYALNGTGTYVDMFTADNTGLGPATNHVRSGVTYSGMTGTLAVPLPSQVAVGVATDHTVGTAFVTGSDIAAAVWGHASRTITEGGITAAAIRAELAVELARIDAAVSSRSTLTTGDLPSVPSAASVASAVRTELTEISNLDASISSRLASASYTAPANSDITAIKSKTDSLPASPAAVADIPTTAQIATAVEGSLLNEADGQAVLNAIVGAIGNTNLSEVSLVAAVRADLERVGGKIDSIPTDSAPSAASVATAVWSASTKEITGGTVTTLTNSPDVPTEAEIASQVRTELSVELGRIDAAVSSRLAPSGTLAVVTTLTNAPTVPTAAAIATQVRTELATELARVDVATSTRLAGSSYTAPSNSDITAIKAKSDLLNTDRLANVATTAIVGNLIAQANS